VTSSDARADRDPLGDLDLPRLGEQGRRPEVARRRERNGRRVDDDLAQQDPVHRHSQADVRSVRAGDVWAAWWGP
jgi:hypothetical protein